MRIFFLACGTTPMTTALSHLPAHKQALLQELKEHLLAHYQEEYTILQIILFGSYATGKWKENRYVDREGTRQEYISDIDILIVTQREKKAQRLEMRVEERLFPGEASELASIIAHSKDFINKELKEHSYFFVTIREEGILLYDSENYSWPKPGKLNPQRRCEQAEEEFDAWFQEAGEFFINYKNAVRRSALKNAAFNLHQATERYYQAVLTVFTGYNPRLHDLKKLSPKAAALHPLMRDAFPRRTDEDKRLFTLLKQAYTQARYKKDWTITAEDLATLAASVEKLRACVEKCCQEQLAYWKKLAALPPKDA